MQEQDEYLFTRLNESNELETIDMVSGKVVSSRSLAVQTLPLAYTPDLGRVVCAGIREGRTLEDICRQNSFPSMHTIYHWMKRYPDFKESVQEARRDQGDFLFDKVLAEAYNADNLAKDDVPAATLKVNTLKWAAEKRNPDAYVQKTKISGDPSAPLTIVVDTGIRRESQISLGGSDGASQDTSRDVAAECEHVDVSADSREQDDTIDDLVPATVGHEAAVASTVRGDDSGNPPF